MISGKYLRNRLTKLVTDRINVFDNEDLDVSDQYYVNEYTAPIHLKERQNPQMEYNWVIRLPDIYIIPAEATSPNNYEEPEFTIPVQEIEHRIDNITVPYDNFETGTHHSSSSVWYSAQRGTVGQMTMVVDEYDDGATLSFFQHWMNLIRNNDGTHNPPVFYKRAVGVYDISSIKHHTHTAVLGGVFPISIEPTGRSQSGQGMLQYTVTFSADAVNHGRVAPEEVLKELEEGQQMIVDAAIDANGVLTDAPNLFVDGLDKIVGIKNIIF